MFFSGEDDMDETGGQVSNVGQQVDGSSDAEESQRLVSCIFCNYSIVKTHPRVLRMPPSFTFATISR